MQHHRRVAMAVGLTVVGSLVTSSVAYGAGYAILEKSAVGIGRAYAGSAAAAEAESSIYYNPAGIASVNAPSVVVGSHLLMSSVSFDGGSQYVASGAPVVGGDGGDAGFDALIPNLYVVDSVNEKLSVGVGVFAPFGLSVEYNEGWVGRYHALESTLETLNINPAIAWQVTDRFSVGAGVSAQYADATLTRAIDYGTLTGVAPGMLDGEGGLRGDDWGYGYNLGLLYALNPGSRVGLSYRSAIDHTLEGRATFTVPDALASAFPPGLFMGTSGSADIETPATASIGYVQALGASLALMCDVVWTEWSAFDELRIEYASGQPDTVTDESWDDTWRVSVGGEYYVTTAWTLRAGMAVDESPIPDAQHRTPRIPGIDRSWLTAGIGYRASEHVVVDAGYAHVFADEDARIDRVSATGDRLTGDFSSTANVYSLQVRWNI